MNQTPPNNRASESGNVFVIVFVSVALFAALMFTFSRSGHQGGDNISKKQAELAAVDVISYAQSVSNAANAALRRGCSEEDLSFYKADMTADMPSYLHSPDVEDKCQIFGGAGATWRAAPDNIFTLPTSLVVITGENVVPGAGTGLSDIIALYPQVKRPFCVALNQKAGVTMVDDAPPDDTGSAYCDGRFNGAYSVCDTIDNAFSGKTAGCWFDGDIGSDGAFVAFTLIYAR